MNNLQRFFIQSKDPKDYFKSYLAYLNEINQTLDFNKLEIFVDRIIQTRDSRKKIFIVGNGGSASTASHMANDLFKMLRVNGRSNIRVVSLCDNVSILTALANDDGYDTIFEAQLAELFDKGDMLISISASGNSPNVVKAAEFVRKHEGYNVALVGFDGGELARISDLAILPRTDKGEYGPVEDVHMIIDHMLTSYLHYRLNQGSEEKL